MRLVQVGIPEGKRGVVQEVLDDAGIDYVVSDETSKREYEATVAFPVPTSAVEDVLDDLRDVGVGENAYTVVTEAETVVSERFQDLVDEYAEETSEERIAREELRAKAEGFSDSFWTYVTMTLVSAIVGTAGLLLDSPATVVGSMVIAPLIGPALSAAVGTVIDDQELFVRGVQLQALGVALTVVAATLFSVFVRTVGVVPPTLDPTTLGEVSERLAPDVLSLAVALGAGVAGIVSLTAGVSTALVGVMIAVALIPPAATVGIALAWGLPGAAVGAAVLTLVNLLSINLAALVVLWYLGYRPEPFFRWREARSATLKRLAVLVVAVAVLSLFLGAVTYSSYTTATTEQNIRGAVEDTLEGREDATLIEVSIERTNEYMLFSEPSRVVVTVGSPPGTSPEDVARLLDERIDEAVGSDVAVQVRYVEVRTVSSHADPGRSSAGAGLSGPMEPVVARPVRGG
ncbi:TIGR00341 family protein [Halomarina litorea]|uniref:TIGR00341 family protein n=1 Tax=Halomarina litorea TaxID=2961595 RepID=UPI0020C2CE74|nr:TIGR00341 family protein [Halomarina sp. BCD28]